MTIRYETPLTWVRYDPLAIQQALVEAKAAVLALNQIPFAEHDRRRSCCSLSGGLRFMPEAVRGDTGAGGEGAVPGYGYGPVRAADVTADWPTLITETEFFRLVREFPKGTVHGFLSR